MVGIFCAASLVAQVTFNFEDFTAFDNALGASFPVDMTASGITLRALSIEGPTSFEDAPDGTEPAIATVISFSGLGVDSLSSSNSGLTETFGDDAISETNALNILEAFTVQLDHSVFITSMRFRDLEQYEKVTVTTGSGVQAVLIGTTPWTAGAGSFVDFTGTQLGALDGYLLERGETLTIQFDTADPLDRVPDGNGNQLTATPSCTWRAMTVAQPASFGLGNPFTVRGSATSATVGGELWGGPADVTLLWTTDPDTGWPNSRSLGSVTEVQFQGLMDGLSADTVWYYKFVADNGSSVVESPVQRFIWGTQFFVSPDGDDDHDGLSETSPLRTVQGALERIKNMGRQAQPEGPVMPNYLVSATSTYGDDLEAHLANLLDPVTVVLLPGWHFLDEPVTIDKTLDGNIHFVGQWSDGAATHLESLLAAHGQDPDWLDLPANEVPVISGGREITHWTVTTVNGRSAWVADLPDVAAGNWNFSQLFVNGKRATRSRWPKEGWFRMAAVDHETRLDFKVETTDLAGIDIANWTNLTDVEVVALKRWVDDRNKIASYNSNTNWINLFPPRSDYDMYGSHPAHEAGLAAYYFDNVFETLSEPGEFYLNRQTGQLYYLPLDGQTPETTMVVAPKLRELFTITGKPANSGALLVNQRLWNVSFKNLAFMHTRTGRLDEHVGTGNSALNHGNAAIRYLYARKGTIEGCFFGHLGEYAIELAYETTGFEIESNLFRSLSAGALKSYQTITPTELEHRTGFHQIRDNDVLGFARFWHGAPAFILSANIFLEFEYNLIRDGTFNGVNVSGVDFDLLRFGHSNIIRKNRIFNVGQGWLSDMAGIYASGQNPHGIMEGNVVSNVVVRDYTGSAIYLDGTAEHWTVRNNWLSGCNTELIVMKGWTHVFENNVMAYAANRLILRANGDKPASQAREFPLIARAAPEFHRNIYLPLSALTYSDEFYSDTISPWMIADNNVFWNDGIDPWVFTPDLTLAQFQSVEAKDLNSIVNDPGFVDPLRGDFRMDPVPSQINALGISSIDNSDAGVRVSLWQASGMPDYQRVPSLPTAWMPSDVPGLVGWLDAADLERMGPLPEWPNKQSFSFTMQQFDASLQPEVIGDYVNGNPVVAFNGSTWMGNDEFGLEARMSVGQFHDRDFTIFAVHRSRGNGTLLLSKGSGGTGGNWSLGETPHSFQWGGTSSIGDTSGAWAVRSWVRQGNTMQFFRNGVLVEESTGPSAYDFSSDEHLFLGKRAGTNSGMLDGEVGEILVFLGVPSSQDFEAIESYLLQKWTTAESIFTASTVVESSAANGIPYARSLIPHIGSQWDASTIKFQKVSGPDWLLITEDGDLTGTPDSGALGPNTFEVQAYTIDGNIEIITLQLQVQEPDMVLPSLPKGLNISVTAGVVQLHWEPNLDPDFSHYVLYRTDNLNTGFTEWANPLFVSQFAETMAPLKRVFYSVDAVDTSGNRSSD